MMGLQDQVESAEMLIQAHMDYREVRNPELRFDIGVALVWLEWNIKIFVKRGKTPSLQVYEEMEQEQVRSLANVHMEPSLRQQFMGRFAENVLWAKLWFELIWYHLPLTAAADLAGAWCPNPIFSGQDSQIQTLPWWVWQSKIPYVMTYDNLNQK